MKKLLITLILGFFGAMAYGQTKTLTASSTDCSVAAACLTVQLNASIGTVAVALQTFTGTVQFEGSANNGTTYISFPGTSTAGVYAASATQVGLWQFSTSGLTNFRVRCSSYSTTIPVSITNSVAGLGGGSGGGTAGGATADKQDALLAAVQDGINISGVITSAMTGTTSTSVIAGSSTYYFYITHCSFENTHASISTYMSLQDGTGGTVLWSGNIAFASSREVFFGERGLKVPTAGNGLFVVNVTTGSSTTAACNGFRSTTSY